MKYLDAFIKETLRLFPPVPITARKVTKEFTLRKFSKPKPIIRNQLSVRGFVTFFLASGLVVPEGVGICLHNWAVHRNPRYWGEDADQFRPERFLQPLTHPAQYMAFSYGSRGGIGESKKRYESIYIEFCCVLCDVFMLYFVSFYFHNLMYMILLLFQIFFQRSHTYHYT